MTIANTFKGPWIIDGDFNDILYSNEKFGSCALNNNREDLILNCFNYYNLIDLGFKGSKYTWTNKRRI